LDWDYQLLPNSIEAAIYVNWENHLKQMAHQRFVPEAAQPFINDLQLKRVIDWITQPDAKFGAQPILGRNQFLSDTFEAAVSDLEHRLGDDMSQWQYGQEKNKHTKINHALGMVVNDSLAGQLNVGPLPRGGNGYTPGSTGNNLRQSSGASFRMIVNTGDWDDAVGTNGPGQSGDPNSPFYDNLFQPWAKDQYFPVYFSKGKIDSVAVRNTHLQPKNQ